GRMFAEPNYGGPTVLVSIGRGEKSLVTETCPSLENWPKTRRLPAVRCMLCWAALTLHFVDQIRHWVYIEFLKRLLDTLDPSEIGLKTRHAVAPNSPTRSDGRN